MECSWEANDSQECIAKLLHELAICRNEFLIVAWQHRSPEKKRVLCSCSVLINKFQVEFRR